MKFKWNILVHDAGDCNDTIITFEGTCSDLERMICSFESWRTIKKIFTGEE